MLEKRLRHKNELGKMVWYTARIYEDLDEARQAGIPFVHWRDVTEKGQWVSSDDGHVGQVLKVSSIRDTRKQNSPSIQKRNLRNISFKSTIGAAFTAQRKPFLAFNPDNVPWIKNHKKNPRFKAFLTTYVSYLVNGRKIDWIRLTRIMYRNRTYSLRYIRRFVKQEEVQEMIREELTRQLDSNGFSFSEILGEYRGLIDACKKKEDLLNLRITLEKFVELHDALPAKKTMSMQFPAGSITGGDHPLEEAPLLSPIDENEAQEEMERVLVQRQMDLLKKGATAEVIE